MDSIKSIRDDQITVKYNGKKYTISLSKELEIDENLINSQLRETPSNYAFLCLLKDKAIKKRDKLERERDNAFSKAWLFYKESDTRVSNEMATHKATCNQKYQSLDKEYLKASATASKLISACRAYESRERVLQTLSANIRKQ